MEFFDASESTCKEECLRNLASSDIVIAIYGSRYGSIDDETNLSMTEVEFDYAVKHGKPILGFVTRDSLEEKQEKFIHEKVFKRNKSCARFSTLEEYADRLYETLKSYLNGYEGFSYDSLWGDVKKLRDQVNEEIQRGGWHMKVYMDEDRNDVFESMSKDVDWLLELLPSTQILVEYATGHNMYDMTVDEIQELSGWEMAIKDFRLGNNSVFITGSNSKLLSHDITTRLSGRYVKFQVRPFIYSEIAECLKEYGREASINDYLIWGGFPGRFALDSIEAQKAYLSDLEETIIYKDLVKRYRIRKDAIFKKIVNFVLCNNSRILSSRSIARYVNAECGPISLNTVMKFIGYLKEAYIIANATPFYTILWLQGHIMIYLGHTQGRAIVAHSVWSVTSGKRYENMLGGVVITTLHIGEEHNGVFRRSKTLLERIGAMSDMTTLYQAIINQ